MKCKWFKDMLHCHDLDGDNCRGFNRTDKDCNLIKKKLKTVFLWKSLDSKKGDRLAEVIREAIEKHGEVTITVE